MIQGVLGFLGAFFVALWIVRKDRALKWPIMIGFLARTFAAIVHAFVFPLPDALNATDFEIKAWEVAQAGPMGLLELLDLSGNFVYSIFIAVPYMLVGRSPFMAQFINVSLGLLIIFATYRLTVMLWGYRRPAMIAAWIMALLPSQIHYSVILLREVYVVLPLMISMIYFVSWVKKSGIKDFVLGNVWLAVGALFHPGIMVILSIVGLFAITKAIRGFYIDRAKDVFGFWIFSSFFAAGMIAMVTFEFGKSKFYKFYNNSLSEAVNVLLSQFDMTDRLRIRDDTYYTIDCANKAVELFYCIPLRALEFTFTPFYWQISRMYDAARFIDVMFISVGFLLIVSYFKTVWQNRAVRFTLLCLLVMIGVYAFGSQEIAQGHRHRAKLIPVFVVIVSYLFAKLRLYGTQQKPQVAVVS